MEAVEEVPAKTETNEAEHNMNNTTHKYMNRLSKRQISITLTLITLPHQSYQHNECSERQFSFTKLLRILHRGTRLRDGAERDDSRKAEVIIAHQQAEDEGHEEGGDSTICV